MWLAEPSAKRNDLADIGDLEMKRSLMKATTLIASLMPAASVMAHAEVTGYNGLQNAAHGIVHALQAHPWLPFATGVAVLAAILIARMIRRES